MSQDVLSPNHISSCCLSFVCILLSEMVVQLCIVLDRMKTCKLEAQLP
jgi:hypothetical protein